MNEAKEIDGLVLNSRFDQEIDLGSDFVGIGSITKEESGREMGKEYGDSELGLKSSFCPKIHLFTRCSCSFRN